MHTQDLKKERPEWNTFRSCRLWDYSEVKISLKYKNMPKTKNNWGTQLHVPKKKKKHEPPPSPH